VSAIFPELGHTALEALADALDRGRLTAPFHPATVARLVGLDAAKSVCASLDGLLAKGVALAALGLMLRAVAHERRALTIQRRRVELVWTGPSGASHGARDTAVVVRDLFNRAAKSVLVVSYALDAPEKARELLAPLAEAMDRAPELTVRFCVNVPRRWGDTRSSATLVAEYGQSFAAERWPGKRMPVVYYDPRSVEAGSARACLHAKFVVIDGQRAFITSANFTEAAHERNIEAGVLLEDDIFAGMLTSRVDALIGAGILERLL
jgi:phosphatidylserine/phosphatidylglycerophosphate/cardiolipin synthase-like enzyme